MAGLGTFVGIIDTVLDLFGDQQTRWRRKALRKRKRADRLEARGRKPDRVKALRVEAERLDSAIAELTGS